MLKLSRTEGETLLKNFRDACVENCFSNTRDTQAWEDEARNALLVQLCGRANLAKYEQDEVAA
jgi:hypothetical protein